MEINNSLIEVYENVTLQITGAPNSIANKIEGSFVYDLKLFSNKKPKAIRLMNPISNICSVPGYMFLITIPELFKTSFSMLDGIYSGETIVNEYSKGEQYQNQIHIRIQRISGPNADPPQLIVTNPIITFTLVYQYW